VTLEEALKLITILEAIAPEAIALAKELIAKADPAAKIEDIVAQAVAEFNAIKAQAQQEIADAQKS
jgi:signal recognition particle receptor subunit beta